MPTPPRRLESMPTPPRRRGRHHGGANMSIISFDESVKVVSRPRPPGPITRAQRARRREAAWLSCLEGGMPDDTGRYRPMTVREIASLFNVSPRTVQQGIVEARRLREAIGNG